MRLTCKGCGARMECQPRPDDARGGLVDVFHPEPLCAHVLGLLAAGHAAGPVTRGRLDLETGEIIDDESGAN